MAPRLTTLVEVQALSIASLVKFSGGSIDDAIAKIKNQRIMDPSKDTLKSMFKTIGTATNVRVNEQWGTQPIYGVGAPTRPILIPGNYQMSLSIEKLQLDRKNAFSFFTSPDYWYSTDMQTKIGQDDFLLYTYLVARDKEKPGLLNSEIYAVLPSSSSQAYSAGDSTIVNNIDCVGFKMTYVDLLNGLKDNGILSYSRTSKLGTKAARDATLGFVADGSNADK